MAGPASAKCCECALKGEGMETIRIGRVSALNYEAGTARIFYSDKNNNTTKELPLLCAEYYMPEVDDLVMVCHLPNGTEAGIILGRYWTDVNRPPEGKRGLYRKDVSRTAGKAMLRYAEDESRADIVMPNIHMKTTEFHMETETIGGSGRDVGFTGHDVALEGTSTLTISGASASIHGDAMAITGGTISISGGVINISGTVTISGAGDVVLDGISLKNHTHTCNPTGTESSKAN